MVEFWIGALGLSLLLYVLLDGFDLGVGMLFLFAPSETARRHMLGAIAPVWDGNETWLVISAAVLFGAFPLVYSVLLDRKSTRLNSSHPSKSRMPSSA